MDGCQQSQNARLYAVPCTMQSRHNFNISCQFPLQFSSLPVNGNAVISMPPKMKSMHARAPHAGNAPWVHPCPQLVPVGGPQRNDRSKPTASWRQAPAVPGLQCARTFPQCLRTAVHQRPLHSGNPCTHSRATTNGNSRQISVRCCTWAAIIAAACDACTKVPPLAPCCGQ